jgi:hypothetical protein
MHGTLSVPLPEPRPSAVNYGLILLTVLGLVVLGLIALILYAFLTGLIVVTERKHWRTWDIGNWAYLGLTVSFFGFGLLSIIMVMRGHTEWLAWFFNGWATMVVVLGVLIVGGFAFCFYRELRDAEAIAVNQ